MTKKPSANSAAHLGRRDGIALCAQMLMEIESTNSAGDGFSRYALESEYRRPGAEQVNIVQAYIDRVRATGNRQLEDGFTALLTEFVASAIADSAPEGSFYLELAESERI